jgi:hypothetical protein
VLLIDLAPTKPRTYPPVLFPHRGRGQKAAAQERAESGSSHWGERSHTKILFIQPAKAPITVGGEDLHLYEPLALECLAAGVAPDHDVRILDSRPLGSWRP